MSSSGERSDRAARVVGNERALRAFGGELSGMSSHSGFVDPVALICECANATCDMTVEATVHEYETVHRDGGCYLVSPSDAHYCPEIEHVLEHSDRFWVVETTETRGERATRRLAAEPLSLRTW
jgi:hypothetical protein